MSSFILKKMQKRIWLTLGSPLGQTSEKPAATSMKRECVQEKASATSCIWSPFLENCGESYMDTIARSIDGGQGLGTRVWTEGSGEIMKDVGNSKPCHFYPMFSRRCNWLTKLVHNGNFLNNNKTNKDGFLNKICSDIVKKNK